MRLYVSARKMEGNRAAIVHEYTEVVCQKMYMLFAFCTLHFGSQYLRAVRFGSQR